MAKVIVVQQGPTLSPDLERRIGDMGDWPAVATSPERADEELELGAMVLWLLDPPPPEAFERKADALRVKIKRLGPEKDAAEPLAGAGDRRTADHAVGPASQASVPPATPRFLAGLAALAAPAAADAGAAPAYGAQETNTRLGPHSVVRSAPRPLARVLPPKEAPAELLELLGGEQEHKKGTAPPQLGPTTPLPAVDHEVREETTMTNDEDLNRRRLRGAVIGLGSVAVLVLAAFILASQVALPRVTALITTYLLAPLVAWFTWRGVTACLRAMWLAKQKRSAAGS